MRSCVGKLLTVWCVLLASSLAWADGAVYAMTNALGNNEIKVYHRANDGSLTLMQTIATGGGGSGLQLAGVDAMGSAGSVQLDARHHLLFAVNTESAAENNGAGAYNSDCQQGTITSFVVGKDGRLTFADRVFSRGLFPNSVTVATRDDDDDHGRGDDKDKGKDKDDAELLYVLNAGGPQVGICNLTPSSANVPNISGFVADSHGRMRALGSTQPIDPGPASANSGVSCLAATAAGFSGLTGAPAADFQCGLNPPSFARSPAQVRFTPDGNQLVVTVKGTNTIYVFSVDHNGTVDGHPAITQASGPALPSYFGFTFDNRDNMLVTELFGSAASIPAGGQGALSSFDVTENGHLLPISSHVGDGGTAACWVAIEPRNGKYAYVANNLSNNISSFAVGHNGTVSLLNGTAGNGSGPNDMATAQEGNASFLYVVDAGSGTVGAFRINGDGSLTGITGGAGLPAGRGAQGIAAY